jgi:hypothetical protein
MGTRGSVAWVRSNGEWQGVYNHFDSYPTQLGQEVWGALRARKFDMQALIKDLKKVKRWENLVDGISKEVDPEEKLFDPRTDPLYMEWIYFLDVKRRVIEVWTNKSVPITKDVKGARVYSVGCKYTHVKVADIKIDGKEPDWEKIEREEEA